VRLPVDEDLEVQRINPDNLYSTAPYHRDDKKPTH